jgi:cell wall assembly regulator SMI1
LTTVQAEFDRLSGIFEQIGHTLKKAPPASEALLASLAAITGIDVDDSLKVLWQISNGSRRYYWFADGDDDTFTPHEFLSIKEVLASWQTFAPYDEAIYAQWYDDESWGERDPRIQRHFLRHSKWLGFAQFNGGSELLQVDADPASQGHRGQIILYSHDPDGIFWRASDFLAFFKQSNDLLQELAADDPEYLAEKLDLHAPATSSAVLGSASSRNVEYEFDGIRVTWPESEAGRSSHSQIRRSPDNLLENSYAVYDLPFILRIDGGRLIIEDDGLEYSLGAVDRGDHVHVAGWNKVFVNGELRTFQTE